MKKFRIHSIGSKYFFATLVLIILPICTFSFLAQRMNLNTSLAQKRGTDLATLNTFSSNIDTFMSAADSIGTLVSKNPDVLQFLKKSSDKADTEGKIYYKKLDNRPFLEIYENAMPSLLAVSLMDADFFFVGEQQLNLDRLTYFFNKTTTEAISKNDFQPSWTKTFSIEFLDTGSVHKVFSVLVPARSSSGRLLGYAVLFFDTTLFNDLLAAYSDDIYVIEGNQILGSKKNLPRNANLFSEVQISYSQLLEDSSVIIENPHDYLIVTTQFFEPLDIHLLLISSYQELNKQLTTSFPSLITIVIYGCFLAILIAFVFSRLLTKHIIELKNVMNHVKDGDLAIRYQPKTKDEIAELGNTFNSLLDRIQLLMAEQKQHQKTKRKMELQMIQEQVKPHFLYNVLEMINSMIRCNMSRQAMTTVEKLASFYRISLSRGSGIISVAQEIQLIENYLCLQKMRYIEFMDYVLAFSPAIYRYAIPKLTMQPLIENSIYHGIKEKGEHGTICVSGYLENGCVVIEVFDTGTGLSPEKLEELREALRSESPEPQNHFGLVSVIRRLNIHYNNEASIRIDSTQGEYTCITIAFPAQEYRQENHAKAPEISGTERKDHV